MLVISRIAAIGVALVLSACGGGGGHGSRPAPSPAPSATAPTITTQPASQTVAIGTAVALQVAATGNGTLSYSWRKGLAPIPGASSATYTIASAAAADTGSYDVLVTNTLNGTVSLASTAAIVTVVSPPTISTQPVPRKLLEGSTVDLNVIAMGGGTLTYSWRKNGIAVAGATTADYRIVNTPVSQSGTYDCVVTNTQGGISLSATSAAVVVTIYSKPVITTETTVVAATLGHVASTAIIAGSGYAWAVTNGTITAGQGTNQITYTAGQLGDAQLVVTVSDLAPSLMAVKNVRVVASVPVATIFAPPIVHTDDVDIRASAAAHSGNTYFWSPSDGTAHVAASFTSNQPLFYFSYGTTGTYLLRVNVTDAANNTKLLTRTLNVANGLFLRHERDAVPRSFHTATLLNDGRVLLVGGDAGVPDFGALVPTAGLDSRIVGSAEMFDPNSDTFADAGAVAVRFGHSATLLNDGRVLVVGGAGATNNYLASAAIYDPDNYTWTAAAALNTARTMHTATLLANGRVLVVGGVNGAGALASAEIYDPAGNSWTPTGALAGARVLHSATRLSDGRVLVAAGRNGALLASAEIYDPTAGSWSAAAALSSPRSAEGAVLLPSGKVLHLGAPVELYDRVANSWSPVPDSAGTPMSVHGMVATLGGDGSVLATSGVSSPVPAQQIDIADGRIVDVSPGLDSRRGSTATPLVSGKIFVYGGGYSTSGAATASHYVALGTAAAYDPVLRFTNLYGSYAHPGAHAVFGTMPSGYMLFAGGTQSRVPGTAIATANASLYHPVNGTGGRVMPMSVSRLFAAATVLADGQMIVTGGYDGLTSVRASAEAYVPNSQGWTPLSSMAVARYRHTLTSLANGTAIAVGGRNVTSCACAPFLSSVERYDPIAQTWSTVNPLLTGRDSHTATLLPDGRVLIVGGYGGAPNTSADTGAALASAEIYDPVTGNWSATGALHTARRDHAAVSLVGGRVLVVGGTNAGGPLASAEIFNVATGLWTTVASMSVARQSPDVAVLGSGRVVAANGLNGTSSPTFGTGTAEIYDPVADAWAPPLPVQVPRVGGAAFTLPDGRVLITGGLPNFSPVPEFYR